MLSKGERKGIIALATVSLIIIGGSLLLRQCQGRLANDTPLSPVVSQYLDSISDSGTDSLAAHGSDKKVKKKKAVTKKSKSQRSNRKKQAKPTLPLRDPLRDTIPTK